MENTKTNSATLSKKENTSKSKTDSAKMKSSQLMKLFVHELKDIYWAEKALKNAIPKMIKNATSKELIKALESHLEETEGQIDRLEKVFKSIEEKAVAKKCEAMAGLINEASEIMDECEEGAMCDAGIITASQKVEHYEIASYGTLCRFAETLGLSEAATLLEKTLKEEKAADQKLTKIATDEINVEASQAKA